MKTFSTEEQRFLLLALLVTLGVSAVPLFSGSYAKAWRGEKASFGRRASQKPAIREARPGPRQARLAPDPNQASLQQLLTLPGMTVETAEAILKHREDHILLSRRDLVRVPGADPALLDAISEHMSFPGRPRRSSSEGPIDVNLAPFEELVRLPGVGPGTARAILDYRQRASFRSVAELLALPGIGPTKLEKLKPFITVKAEDGGENP